MKIEEIYSGGVVGTTYLFLQIPALILAYFSFKLNKNWFEATEADDPTGEIAFLGNTVTSHQMSKSIMGGGVCLLGKWVAMLIYFKAILSSVLLYAVNTKKPEYKNTILGVLISNSILLGGLIIGATLMNPPLSARNIPFYFLQIGVIIYLVSTYSLLNKVQTLQSQIDEENNSNENNSNENNSNENNSNENNSNENNSNGNNSNND